MIVYYSVKRKFVFCLDFEWIVTLLFWGTHRRFIEGVKIIGKINAR